MIKDLIIENYESNLEKLSLRRRLHFLVRRFRTTGEEKYIPLINSIYKELLPRFKKVLLAFSSDAEITRLGKEAVANYEPTSIRKARRLVYYQKDPKDLIYIEAALYMFFIKSFGMENSDQISKEYEIARSYFKEKRISKGFLDKKHWVVNPSESANMINFLSYLDIVDERDSIVKIFREYWLNIEPTEPSIWLDKVYSLTHLIIGESNYYQNFVKRERFDWAFKYFQENFDEIAERVSLDSLGEIGICFKLARDSRNKIIIKISDLLEKEFDKKVGYIPNENNPSLAGSEHRNAIALMVLENIGELYKGPLLRDINRI